MASYKLIWVNWDSRITYIYLNLIREVRPKDILGTQDSGKGVTSLPWPKKTTGIWDYNGMVIWYLVCTLRSDKLPTVLRSQLSSVHCCFHSPLNLHLPVCLLTCTDLDLPFLHWHSSSLSPEAGLTLQLRSQLWISHSFGSSSFPAGWGSLSYQYRICLNFDQTTSGSSWALL